MISADTGALHIADLFGRQAIALMGPTAFGLVARPTSVVLSVPLDCRPCSKDGRGRCSQKIYQRCMVEITPAQVGSQVERFLRMDHNKCPT